MCQGREIAQLQVRVTFDTELLTHGGEHLGLLDRVDTQVGLEVEIHFQHVGRVTGLVGDEFDDFLLDTDRKSVV